MSDWADLSESGELWWVENPEKVDTRDTGGTQDRTCSALYGDVVWTRNRLTDFRKGRSSSIYEKAPRLPPLISQCLGIPSAEQYIFSYTFLSNFIYITSFLQPVISMTSSTSRSSVS